jgi:hypothetical protein
MIKRARADLAKAPKGLRDLHGSFALTDPLIQREFDVSSTMGEPRVEGEPPVEGAPRVRWRRTGN